MAEAIAEFPERFGMSDDEVIFYGTHGTAENSVSVFANKQLLDQAASVERAHVDGTFKSRPSIDCVKQLFTILGIFHGVVSII